MRTLTVLLLTILMTAVAFGSPELVYDRNSKTVVFGAEAGTPWFPASLTKAMTIYVALDGVRAGRYDLDEPIVISAAALRAEPTKMNFPVGTRIRLEDALIILAVKSANDVALAVAESLDGSVEAFVARMNETSERIGMEGSSWRNPHGLHHPEQRTTAKDISILADQLLTDFPESAKIFSASGFVIGGATVKSHNALLGRIEGVDGMKTGYTCASGFNIVTTAQRDGRSIVAVVLGMRTARERDARVAHLVEAAYAAEPSAIGLDMVPDGDGAAKDMRPMVCGGRGGDTDDDVGQDRWESRFTSMPRELGPPVVMGFLPRYVVDIPLPRTRPVRADAVPVAPSSEGPVKRF